MMKSNSTKEKTHRLDVQRQNKNKSIASNIHYNNWKKSKQPRSILKLLQGNYNINKFSSKMDSNHVCFLMIPSIKGFTINYSHPTDADHRFLFEWLKEICVQNLNIKNCTYSKIDESDIYEFPSFRERYILHAAADEPEFKSILLQIEYQNHRIVSLKFSASNSPDKSVCLNYIFNQLLA